MFTMRKVENNQEAELFLEKMSASFTQSALYAGWQVGRTIQTYIIENEGKIVGYFQAIKYPLILGKSYYYIPYGPVFNEQSAELLAFLRTEMNRLKDKGVVYVRLDFSPKLTEEKTLAFAQKKFYKVPSFLSHGSCLQPRQEWILPINAEPEKLLENMHKNTRYSIRTAEKRGVKVEIVRENFLKYFPDFYRLLSATARRNSFSLHAESYYKNIFTRLDENNDGRSFLSVASFDGRILVIDLITIFGQTANYVFSGSDSESRNLMPAYLAQWESILEAKRRNCLEYNFGGVDMSARKKGGWAGLTDYKVKFGGHLVTHGEFYDIIWEPFWYFLYLFRKLFK